MITMIGVLVFIAAGTTAYGAVQQSIDVDECLIDTAGEGWQWEASTKCLTLSGLEMNDLDKKSTSIELPADSTIILEKGTVNNIHSHGILGIYTSGNLTIKGEGQLNIEMLEEGKRGILIGREGRNYIESGKITITGANTGIYLIGGDYHQSGGEVVIHDLDNQNSRGINTNSGNVIIDQGQLTIKADEYGIKCGEMQVHDGSLNVIHEGNETSGKAGIYLGKDEESFWDFDVDSKTCDFMIDGGNLTIDGWNNGIFIADGGSYRQTRGQVQIPESKQFGVCVFGGDSKTGTAEITGGQFTAHGDSAAMMVMILNGQAEEKPYITLKDSAGTEDYKYLCCQGYFTEANDAPVGLAGIVSQKWYDELEDGQKVEVSVNSMDGVFLKNIDLSAEGNAIPSMVIYIDGEKIDLATANAGSVYIDENGRTIVPLRTITEAMGCTAKWDAADQSITITDGKDATVVFYLDQKTYWVNGEERQMDTTAISLPPGRTHVPLRFVAESLGAQVEMTSAADGRPQIQITTRK